MYRKILFPVDLQETTMSERAVQVAVEQARRHGAALHVLTVMPGVGMPWVSTYFPRSALDKARRDLEKKLAAWVAQHVPEDVTVTTRVEEGTPYREILQETDRIGADLVVLASHDDPRITRALLGSCATKVVEHAHVSVMVVRDRGVRSH